MSDTTRKADLAENYRSGDENNTITLQYTRPLTTAEHRVDLVNHALTLPTPPPLIVSSPVGMCSHRHGELPGNLSVTSSFYVTFRPASHDRHNPSRSLSLSHTHTHTQTDTQVPPTS